MEIDKRKREIKKLLNKYVRLRNGEKYKIVKYKIFDYESEDIGVITLQDIGGGSDIRPWPHESPPRDSPQTGFQDGWIYNPQCNTCP
jgi:hypothetical protein